MVTGPFVSLVHTLEEVQQRSRVRLLYSSSELSSSSLSYLG